MRRKSLSVLLLAGMAGLLLLAMKLGQSAWAVAAAALIAGAIALFFAAFERRRPQPRDLVPVAVLSAAAAGGRILFAALPDVKPTSAVVIVAGTAFGPQAGFMTGATAALLSNFFFGQGSFTPWQMFAWGMMGFFAGLLGRFIGFRRTVPMCVYGVIACYAYGAFMDLYQLLGFVRPITWTSALLTWGASIALDSVHAAATAAFLALIARPWLRVLLRVQAKYGLLTATKRTDENR